jgi:hypothetical protein
MSYDEVADKFRGCADFAKWPSKKTEAVVETVKILERVSDMSSLAENLTA